MKSSTVLKTLVIALISVFAIHQIISSLYKPIKTETAAYTTAADGINITGLIIRNETLIKAPSSGVLHFVTGDGSRAPKDGVIANIYDSESASVTISRIDSVNAKIADIEEMLSYNDLEAADLDMINNKIKLCLNNLIINSSGGDFQSISDYSESLLSALNRRQAAMGETADFSAQLTALKSELTTCESRTVPLL